MRWVLLRQPLRRNGGWRCGVELATSGLVAQVGAQARGLLICIAFGPSCQFRLPLAIPWRSHGVQVAL